MAVAKFLFYLLAYLLIHLGAAVRFIVSIPFLILRYSFHYTQKLFVNFKTYSRGIKLPKVNIGFKKPNLSKFSFKFNNKRTQKYEYGSPKKVKVKERKQFDFGILSKLKYFLFGGVFSAIFIFIPLAMYIFISDLPTLDKLSVSQIPQTTKLYDRNGELLYEFYATQNRTIVSLSTLPDYLKEATIAIEDQNFYSHPGFDIRGISRAILANITDDYLQGGSTITQQLIKSALLTPETTIKRKLKEATLAILAEREYSKDEILELYFNYVPYGGTAWGIEAAAQTYFGKSSSEVNLSEAAFLAGLPRAPSIYSPYISSKNTWKNRQWEVLTAMVRDGYINEREAYEAYSQNLTFRSPQTSIKAPHFVMHVKEELIKRYGIYEVERGGLSIITSLDLEMQAFAEREVSRTVKENSYLGIGNAAALITDPENGDILAMVGSKDFFDNDNDGNVNLTTSLRQPGSTIKIVGYAAALENGFSESSVLQDTPVTIEIAGSESYRPVNYDGRFRGMVPLRLALANSYNIPAVRIAEQIGPLTIADYGRRMGISSWSEDDYYGLSIALGGNEVTMVDLATVYGTIANSGQRVRIDPILVIEDSSGNVVYEKSVESTQVISEGVAFILSDILSDNSARSSAFGSNSILSIPGKRVAVKTGTTDNKRDNWTVGYTKDYVVATWVGNNDNTPLSPTLASGVTGAAPLWRTIMEDMIKDKESELYVIPNELVSKNCFGYEAYFVRGTQDSGSCRIQRPSPTPITQ